ncbi:hypothetical protein N7516_000633 [Penicillium verrucosum]|uniref:uncharacterized protein n=1 Tax=Penicillium verrucosum TaxID=60171 RepID=UPI00254579DF|nr:uncharacterized protein N7516_000633 [Penicillium verrucosum]KAJ5940465.1 hypothetical protein N7516_000633 [Penicillium verrucosum]
MDSPNRELDAQPRPPKELLCPPLEHQGAFSICPSEPPTEQWPSPEGILPQDTLLQALDEPFQLLAEESMRSTQPSAQQAAEAWRLYSTLCAAYNAKKAESQHLENENEALRIANINLVEQQRALECHHTDHEALITYYGQIFDKVRGKWRVS